jgi:hypothetical protein
VVRNAFCTWATVPEAATHRLPAATLLTLMPWPERNDLTLATCVAVGANRELNWRGVRYFP